jgi:hypothetical protein
VDVRLLRSPAVLRFAGTPASPSVAEDSDSALVERRLRRQRAPEGRTGRRLRRLRIGLCSTKGPPAGRKSAPERIRLWNGTRAVREWSRTARGCVNALAGHCRAGCTCIRSRSSKNFMHQHDVKVFGFRKPHGCRNARSASSRSRRTGTVRPGRTNSPFPIGTNDGSKSQRTDAKRCIRSQAGLVPEMLADQNPKRSWSLRMAQVSDCEIPSIHNHDPPRFTTGELTRRCGRAKAMFCQ